MLYNNIESRFYIGIPAIIFPIQSVTKDPLSKLLPVGVKAVYCICFKNNPNSLTSFKNNVNLTWHGVCLPPPKVGISGVVSLKFLTRTSIVNPFFKAINIQNRRCVVRKCWRVVCLWLYEHAIYLIVYPRHSQWFG